MQLRIVAAAGAFLDLSSHNFYILATIRTEYIPSIRLPIPPISAFEYSAGLRSQPVLLEMRELYPAPNLWWPCYADAGNKNTPPRSDTNSAGNHGFLLISSYPFHSDMYSAVGFTCQTLPIFFGCGWIRPSCTQRSSVLLCGAFEKFNCAHS